MNLLNMNASIIYKIFLMQYSVLTIQCDSEIKFLGTPSAAEDAYLMTAQPEPAFFFIASSSEPMSATESS